MNERILELAKQACAYWHHIDFNMSSVEFQEKELENFTELIVRECVDVVAKDLGGGMTHSEFSDGVEWGLKIAISAIKEHFGVKE